LDKDPETNRNFELSEIFDRLRMRIMLRKEHMTNPEKRDGVIKQIISYVCGILGTDISETRLRYSFESGGTNGNSTGKHQAMHFTSRVRYECDSNPSMRTINLEVQIHGYMNSKEIDDDHNVYVGKKDARTTRMLGMDVPFQDFVEDLCDAILSDEDFADTNKITRKTFEFPLREKMARILFGILTKLDLENGLLKNGRIISEMLKDERKAKKLRKVIEIYKGAEAASVAYVRTGLQRMQGRVATIGTLDGWRGNIQEQIAVATEGKNVRTSLNILAEKAEDTINELERYASRPPAPVASMIIDDEFFGDGGWNEKNN
jgi:hypothetical protein